MNTLRFAVTFFGVVSVSALWAFKDSMPKGVVFLAYVAGLLSVTILCIDLVDGMQRIAPLLPDVVRQSAEQIATTFAVQEYTEEQKIGLAYVLMGALGLPTLTLIACAITKKKNQEFNSFWIFMFFASLPLTVFGLNILVYSHVREYGYLLYQEQVVRAVFMSGNFLLAGIGAGVLYLSFSDDEESALSRTAMFFGGIVIILLGGYMFYLNMTGSPILIVHSQ